MHKRTATASSFLLLGLLSLTGCDPSAPSGDFKKLEAKARPHFATLSKIFEAIPEDGFATKACTFDRKTTVALRMTYQQLADALGVKLSEKVGERQEGFEALTQQRVEWRGLEALK